MNRDKDIFHDGMRIGRMAELTQLMRWAVRASKEDRLHELSNHIADRLFEIHEQPVTDASLEKLYGSDK